MMSIFGIRYHSEIDVSSCKVSLSDVSYFTKRNLLSETFRVYDPIWLILPTTIAMKMLLQQLWQLEWKYEPTDYMKFRWLLTISK